MAMKRILSILLFIILVFTASFGFAAPQDEFFQFISNLKSEIPEGFFQSKVALFHSPIFKQTKNAADILADAKLRCQQTASLFSEVAVLRRYSPNAAEYFGSYMVESDPSMLSYIGRDGTIISCYVLGTDCGYFMLYDLSSQLMYIDFVASKTAEEIERVLFERCADGYYVNEVDTLKEEMTSTAAMYEQIVAQLMGL